MENETKKPSQEKITAQDLPISAEDAEKISGGDGKGSSTGCVSIKIADTEIAKICVSHEVSTSGDVSASSK